MLWWIIEIAAATVPCTKVNNVFRSYCYLINPLFIAAANGEVECLKVLKQFSAAYFANESGNFPIRKKLYAVLL